MPGAHYGNNAASDKVPINLLKLAVAIYGRQLVSPTPRVLVTTSDTTAKAEAYGLEVATNDLLEQHLNLSRVLRLTTRSPPASCRRCCPVSA